MNKTYGRSKKGITLVELVVYMSLLIVVVGLMFSVVFYVQRILTTHQIEYVIRTHTYEYAELLQQQLYRTTHISHSAESITLHMQDTGAVLDLLSIQHRIKDGKIALEYRYRDSVRNKEIYLYEGVIFNMLQFVLSSSTPYIHTTSSQGRITVHMQIDNFSRSMLNILQDVYIPNL